MRLLGLVLLGVIVGTVAHAGFIEEAKKAGGRVSHETKKGVRHVGDVTKKTFHSPESLVAAIRNAPNQVAKEGLKLAQDLLGRKATCDEFRIAHPIGWEINMTAVKHAKKKGILESKKECKNFERKKGKLANLIFKASFPKGAAAQMAMGWDFTYFECVCNEIDWE